jgi:hypothetical protein
LIARHPRLRQAWYTIAIAAEDGRLVDFGANAKQARYHGPEIPGQTTLALGPREVGSIAKVLAALVLARSGDSPNTMYRQLPRRKANGEAYVNMGGFRGSLHRKISARRAFAQSDNLALMARLEDEAPEELRSLLRVFGFRPRNPNTKLPMESIEALVLGTAKATPRDIHRLFQVVGLNLHKSSNSKTSCTTHLVQAVKSAAQGWKAIDPQWMGCQSARRLLRTDSEQKYLREVLEGVVSPGGTAHSALGQFRPSKNDRIQFHIAKTGTVGKANGVNRYGAVAGALVLDGRLYTYVAQIGANAGFHLGRHVGGRHAADLVQPALERLISRSSR